MQELQRRSIEQTSGDSRSAHAPLSGNSRSAQDPKYSHADSVQQPQDGRPTEKPTVLPCPTGTPTVLGSHVQGDAVKSEYQQQEGSAQTDDVGDSSRPNKRARCGKDNEAKDNAVDEAQRNMEDGLTTTKENA